MRSTAGPRAQRARPGPGSSPATAEKRSERPQPVAARREDDVRHAERRQDARHATALLRGGDGEALAQRCAPGVDPNLAARLGVDEPELADIGELLLARGAELDREDVMPVEHAQQRRAPPMDLAPGAASGSRPSFPSSPRRPGRPCVGGTVCGLESPKVTMPRRFPLRVAMYPRPSATPAATSALRRSPVQ